MCEAVWPFRPQGLAGSLHLLPLLGHLLLILRSPLHSSFPLILASPLFPLCSPPLSSPPPSLLSHCLPVSPLFSAWLFSNGLTHSPHSLSKYKVSCGMSKGSKHTCLCRLEMMTACLYLGSSTVTYNMVVHRSDFLVHLVTT